MIKVENIINDIIAREGGFVNHPNDNGGPTKYGITIKTLEDYLNKKCFTYDVRNLSKDLARDIYREKYYRKPKIDLLPVDIQPLILDSAVHHGPDDPILFIQRVCNQIDGIEELSVDGVNGPATRKAAHKAQDMLQSVFLEALIEERMNYMHYIVSRDPSQGVFLKGWLNRLEDFRHE